MKYRRLPFQHILTCRLSIESSKWISCVSTVIENTTPILHCHLHQPNQEKQYRLPKSSQKQTIVFLKLGKHLISNSFKSYSSSRANLDYLFQCPRTLENAKQVADEVNLVGTTISTAYGWSREVWSLHQGRAAHLESRIALARSEEEIWAWHLVGHYVWTHRLLSFLRRAQTAFKQLVSKR